MGVGEDVKIPPNLIGIVRNFQISRMGGETIQWQTGHWGDMPLLVIEMFVELSTGLNRGFEKKRERDTTKSTVRNPGARRNPYTSG